MRKLATAVATFVLFSLAQGCMPPPMQRDASYRPPPRPTEKHKPMHTASAGKSTSSATSDHKPVIRASAPANTEPVGNLQRALQEGGGGGGSGGGGW